MTPTQDKTYTRDRAAADYIITDWGDRTTLAHALLVDHDLIVDDVMPQDHEEVLRDATLLCGGDIDFWTVQEDEGRWEDDNAQDLLDGALRDAVEYGALRRALDIRWSMPLYGPDGDPIAGGIIWRMGNLLVMVDHDGSMTTRELVA